jgi:transposase InsO family protein
MPVEPDWRGPFISHLLHGWLPEDQAEARRLARRAKSFVMHNGELHHRSASGILQRCVTTIEGRTLLFDIHEGVCGHHAAPRSLVGKAFRQGFYWPTAVNDARDIVRSCQGCQYFARQTHVPAQELQNIPITWPFAVWGIDLLGPFARAPGGYTHLFVAVDKFTKWVEAKPVSSVTAGQAKIFLKDIVFRFGVPNSIITDNGTQFTGKPFLDFCDAFQIKIDWAAVAHPRTNGQAERANGMILQGLKPRIFDPLREAAGRWAEEVPSVLWSLRTTPSRATGLTPFYTVYGAEAVLPTELDFGSPRVRNYDPEVSERARQDAVDQVDEAREAALLQSAKYQQALRRYHSKHVMPRGFEQGDLVLRRVQSNKGKHKLSAPWEGPYEIARVLRPGTYKLKTMTGEEFKNAWNIQHLRRFYP